MHGLQLRILYDMISYNYVRRGETFKATKYLHYPQIESCGFLDDDDGYSSEQKSNDDNSNVNTTAHKGKAHNYEVIAIAMKPKFKGSLQDRASLKKLLGMTGLAVKCCQPPA